jgi:hypothetical protein
MKEKAQSEFLPSSKALRLVLRGNSLRNAVDLLLFRYLYVEALGATYA